MGPPKTVILVLPRRIWQPSRSFGFCPIFHDYFCEQPPRRVTQVRLTHSKQKSRSRLTITIHDYEQTSGHGNGMGKAIFLTPTTKMR